MKNSRINSRIRVVCATVAMTGLAAFAGPATAGAPKTDSTVTVTEEGFNFKGKVKSEKHICEARRLVRVYRKDNQGDKFLVGADKTDNSGSYKFDVNVINGGDAHFAVAQLKETDKAICVKAKSPSFFPNDT